MRCAGGSAYFASSKFEDGEGRTKKGLWGETIQFVGSGSKESISGERLGKCDPGADSRTELYYS